MGYFTWTDANKQPRKTESGDWRKSDIIQYGEYDNDAAYARRHEYNTRMVYLYRDADNYKAFQEYVVKGPITDAQKQAIKECLDGGEMFIPEALDMPLIRGWDYDPESDHPWCELDVDTAFSPTHQAPDDPEVTADVLVQRFIEHKGKWGALSSLYE